MRLDFEKFLNENGLKVEDKVRFSDKYKGIYTIVYKTALDISYPALKSELNEFVYLDITNLLVYDFEKIESKKKIGELTCNEYRNRYGCKNCVFTRLGIRCAGIKIKCTDILNEVKETYLKEHPLAEPLRPVIETELDKEVEE